MWGVCVERPDAGCVVCGTGCEVADIGGEENAGYVCGVCGEFANGDDGGCVVALDHAPDVDVSLAELASETNTICIESTHGVVTSANHTSVTCNCDARDTHVVFGYQLVTALILT